MFQVGYAWLASVVVQLGSIRIDLRRWRGFVIDDDSWVVAVVVLGGGSLWKLQMVVPTADDHKALFVHFQLDSFAATLSSIQCFSLGLSREDARMPRIAALAR